MTILSLKKFLASAMVVVIVFAYGVVPKSYAMLAPAANEAAAGFKGAERAQNMETVEVFLQKKVVRQRLLDLGMSEKEVSTRLSRLSDQEMKQVAAHIEREIPAGDGAVGLLVVVVLVLLIIYLVKRV